MINYENLTDFDFEILEKVSQSSDLTVTTLTFLLPNQKAVPLRVYTLSKPDYLKLPEVAVSIPVPNFCYLSKLAGEKLKLTQLGEKVLEDYHAAKRKDKRKLFEDRFWKFISCLALVRAFAPELKEILSAIARELAK